MRSKSTKESAVVSGDTENKAEVSQESSFVELYRRPGYKMPVESNGSVLETDEHSLAPSEMEGQCKMNEKEEEEELDDDEEKEEEEKEEEDDDEVGYEEEDIQNVYEIEDRQGFNRLYRAVECGETETVRSLLMSSVDVNVLDANKHARSQLYAIVKKLLYKNDDVDPRNAFDRTSLHVAHENGAQRNAQGLLKSNVNGNIASNSCRPLTEEIVKALIDYVGGINEVDKHGDTALHLAARYDRNALVKILFNQSEERKARSHLKLGAYQVPQGDLELSEQPNRNKVDVGEIPYDTTAHSDNLSISKTQLGLRPIVKADYTGQGTQLHGHRTAEREHVEIVENLIFKNGANVNACNTAKKTPLHLACQNGYSSIVEILLDNHATVDVTKQSRETPFYLAAKNGHADVVDVLLRRGICDFVEIDLFDRIGTPLHLANNRIGTPLHVAVRQRHTEVVEVILKHSCRMLVKLTKEGQKFKENDNDFIKKTDIVPIELLKSDDRRASAGMVWIEKCTPLETIHKTAKDTALELAVKSIQPKMVKILLSGDRRAYSEQHIGESFRCMIMTIIEMDQQYECLYKLESPNIIDLMEVLCYDIKHEMKCKNIKEIARVLMTSKNFDVNHKDEHLNTLLLEVIRQCRSCFYDCFPEKSRWRLLQIQTLNDVMQLLLENGADFNMKNAYGHSPLILASEMGCSHAIQTLFDWEQKSGLKLDRDAVDRLGATALIKAVERHRVTAVRLLLRHKVSVNLHDYYGFTALHAALYEPNRNLFDMHFFCNRLLKGIMNNHEDFLKIKWREIGLTADPSETIERLKSTLNCDKKTTQFNEEIVKLLLTTEEINVNAVDFKGNTPLDLAVKSSRRINAETFRILKDRGAICNSLEPMDEAPLEVARIDKRGRGPLHRLIISHISNCTVEDIKLGKKILYSKRFAQVLHAFFLEPENFKESATEVDDKGRTPLHYAVLLPAGVSSSNSVLDLTRALLEIASSVNEVDRYGKTPLHYAEMNFQYEFLIQHGSDESIKDKNGHTPKDLRQLRESVTINIDNAKNLQIGYNNSFRTSIDIIRALNANHVTDLSKRKLPVAVQIYSQSPRPKDSSEKKIWNIWIQNDLLGLNRRLSKLKPSIQRFIDRLADGIKEKDERFECQPILVGSAYEETKAVLSTDFDFNFKLISFSRLCDVFPHPLGPKGYFQLRRKSKSAKGRQGDEEFDCFFNLDHCLLTDEVNSRFHIALEDVLYDPNFWQNEHQFEWILTDTDTWRSLKLCKTVRLRITNPIEDGEGGFLFVIVSIDVVACVHMEYSCFGDQLPVDICPSRRADGCTLVFDRPRFDPFKAYGTHYRFSDTFARISFAPVESRTIRESSSLIKAAYIVCKLILYDHKKTTYQLKTALLFCMKALKIFEVCERKKEDRIAPKELAFWVERLMFCFMEFSRHDVYPCYFMPSFKQRVRKLDEECIRFKLDDEDDEVDTSLRFTIPFKYSAIFDMYLDLCPDDTTINVPIFQNEYTHDSKDGSLIVNQDPKWEHFDREEFIRKLASRSPSF